MRACFIGDSIVSGVGDRMCLGWVGRVCSHHRKRGFDITCYNLGVRGETSENIMARWEAETVPRLKPEYQQLAVFSFGVNDTKIEQKEPKIALPRSIENAETILSGAAKRYPVMMIGPIAVRDSGHNTRIQVLSEHMASLCSQISIPYLNIYNFLVLSTEWMDSLDPEDGIHPNDHGYELIASLVLQWELWQKLVR